MRLLLLSDDAFQRLKGLLQASEYFEPDPRGEFNDGAIDQEIVNDIKLAVPVEGEPGPLYERIRHDIAGT